MLLIVDGKKCYTKGRRGLPCATAWAAYGIDFCMMWTCYVNGVLICNDIFLFLDRGGLQIMYSCWIFGLRNNFLYRRTNTFLSVLLGISLNKLSYSPYI